MLLSGCVLLGIIYSCISLSMWLMCMLLGMVIIVCSILINVEKFCVCMVCGLNVVSF